MIDEIDYTNVGVNSDIITSLLYQIYMMGRFRGPGEDYELYKQEEGSSFNMDFDLSFE